MTDFAFLKASVRTSTVTDFCWRDFAIERQGYEWIIDLCPSRFCLDEPRDAGAGTDPKAYGHPPRMVPAKRPEIAKCDGLR